PNSDDDVDGLLESTSMVNLIKHHFSRATGYDFAGTEEFTAWYQFVRPLRNGIAHRSMLYVERNDAIRAMKIVQSCIENTCQSFMIIWSLSCCSAFCRRSSSFSAAGGTGHDGPRGGHRQGP